MRTIQTTIYRYSELQPKAQEKVRNDFIEDMHGWHDATLEDANQIATYLGFTECSIFYSGFYSQGDGASFTGTWYRDSLDSPKLESHAPIDTELRRIAEELAKAPSGLRVDITRSGNYYHENSMDFQFYEDDEYAEDHKDIIEAFKSFARWIYKQLQTDYESQTTEEAIAEAVADNEYYEDGVLYLGDDDDEEETGG